MGVPNTKPVLEPMDEAEATMLLAGLRRLATRWRTLATRIEPYAPPAARAYEQAAEDLEEELQQHPGHVDALRAFRDAVIAALRDRER